jgi:ubiquitin carboxyl-terminal hydrolase 22/27/51
MQRFKQFNGSASKIDTKVSFPLKLEMFPYTSRSKNLAKFVTKNKEEELDKEKQTYELARGCTYDLQSVVVHVGELETGKTNQQLNSPVC